MSPATSPSASRGSPAISALVLLALVATPANAGPAIDVRVIGARASADGATLELTVAALVEGKAPPKTPSLQHVHALAGTVSARATSVRSVAGDPRAVTLLIDTGSLPPPDGIVHRAAGAFLKSRPSTESLQIVTVDHEPHGLEVRWTANREQLAGSLKAVRIPRRPGSLLFEGIGRSLEGLAQDAALPEQRAMILVSDGLDLGSAPPWTFDFVRELAEDSGVPIIPIFVPPLGRGQGDSARRALAVLAERSGGRIIELGGGSEAWPNVTAPALERALLQAGEVLNGVFVVRLQTGSLPAGRLTGTLSMLGLKTPFNVALATPVIAPDVDPAELATAPTPGGSTDRQLPLALMGLVLLVSAGVAFVVARRTAGPSWDEIASGASPPQPPAPFGGPPPDAVEPDEEPTERMTRAGASTFDPPSSSAFDDPPTPLLDPVPEAEVLGLGAWHATELSHRGPREQNQDFLGSVQQPDRDERVLFVLADGMGGHAGGYQASRVAVDAAHQAFGTNGAIGEPEAILRLLVHAANEAVHRLSEENPALQGCGTTLVLLLAQGQQVYCAHVGDSRLYRLRDGEMEQLTEDHSLLRVLVEAGALTAEEAAVDPRGHVLSQAVGSSRSLDVDVAGPMPVEDRDRFLLCSDGLSGVLSAERMAEIMNESDDATAAQLLVMDALNSGTEDNTTVLIASPTA
jgi:serine/threonine protein phosphatase PrpC